MPPETVPSPFGAPPGPPPGAPVSIDLTATPLPSSDSGSPRLRALAEAAFGPGSYEQEVEAGLAAVTLDLRSVDGPRASLPLFGMTLPVPVGIGADASDPDAIFASQQELEDYLRRILINDTDRFPAPVDVGAWARAAEADARVARKG